MKPDSLSQYHAALNGDPEKWERYLDGQMAMVGLHPVPQFAFALDWTPRRQYRADFAFVKEMLLIEVDGGTWISGGHNRGAAYARDRERDNEALCHGWRTIRVVPSQIESGKAVRWVEVALHGAG
jgi:hypothetical protein